MFVLLALSNVFSADLNEFFPQRVAVEENGTKIYLTRSISAWAGVKEPVYLPSDQLTADNLNDLFYEASQKNNLKNGKIEGKEVTLKDGLLYVGDQKVVDVSTIDLSFNYVMDQNFRLFIHKGAKGGHVLLRGGAYCLAAGELKFDENGNIFWISNQTGHMRADESQLKTCILALASKGMLADDALSYNWNDAFSSKECRDMAKIEFDSEPSVPIISAGSGDMIKKIQQMRPQFGPKVEEKNHSRARKVYDLSNNLIWSSWAERNPSHLKIELIQRTKDSLAWVLANIL